MTTSADYPWKFDKYVLVAPLARGGMGELHLALSGRSDLRKLCVIKQIIGHLATAEYVGRFADETALMVKLGHGNLVPVFEGGIFEGQYFLAMEFIDGKDLRSVWNRIHEQQRPRCPLDVALHIVREICRGLHYAHTFSDLQLVHRDVSPPNVLLSYTGEVKLTDFGLAFTTMKLQKTAPGVLFGKLSYMAPEQARNDPVDARTDIFSAGVVLWELVTGQRLFPAEGSQLDQLTRASSPEILPPSKIDPALPPALDLIVLRALAVDKEHRYQTAEAMRRDLAGFLAQVDPTTDAASVQRWLRELYGDEIDQEQRQRRQLLDDMAGPIQRLLEESVPSIERARTERRVSPLDLASLRAPDVGDDSGGHASREWSAPLPVLGAGTVIGERYRIDGLIREGGMGTIYRATHTGIDKQVAVKVLHPMYTRMPDVVSRFRREAKAASRIGHPHIVEVYDSGTTESGSVYIVMEHLEGWDLADVLTEVGRLEVDRAIVLAIQVCQAVAAAHAVGIVHRDLKPENIFLTTRDGQVDFVKVLDFGIAQMSAQQDSFEQLTNPGTPLGTPEYMAPEQAAGRECDHRADIYAVGTLLYEMLVGRTPDQGETMIEVLASKARPSIVPPSEERPELPPELERIVLWALSHEPDDRPQTMNELAYELTKLIAGRAGAVASILGLPSGEVNLPLTTTEVDIRALDETGEGGEQHAGQPRRRWRRVAWIAAGVVLVAGASAAITSAIRGQESALAPRRGAVRLSSNGDAGRHQLDQGLAPGVAASDARTGEADDLVGSKKATGARHMVRVGQQHLQQGRFERARQAFRVAQRSPQTRVHALTGLAELEFQRGHFREAQRHAREAVDAGGGLRAELVLGNICFKLGDFFRAVAMYEQVLARDAAHEEARRNLEAARRKLRSPGH